jgi:hypothetical protein
MFTRLASKKPRVRQDVEVNCKDDANPVHLSRLGVTSLHVDSRGPSWIACGTTWTRRPALAIGGASWTMALSSTSSTRPQLEEAVLNGLFP